MGFTEDKKKGITGGYTKEQIEAVQWYKGAMMVLGTPGAGKTTVIVNRVNNLICQHGVKPENILVITFTRAAADSMRERFLEMTSKDSTSVRFSTFHSFFFWIVRTAFGQKFNLGVLDENMKRSVLKNILKGIDQENFDNEELLASVLNQLGILSCNMIDIENYYSKDMPEDQFRELYRKYEKYKTDNGVLDFDDMVTRCYKLLKDRPDILDAVRRLYPFILVDEYQDTNRIQYELLKMLAKPLENVFVVGDDDQSIYGFRGARPDIMKLFEKDFHNAKVMQLSNNFRCPSEIVDFSSKIIAENKNRYDKMLVAANSKRGVVRITETEDAAAENQRIIKRIKKAVKSGFAYNDIAILYRTNVGPRRLMYKMRLEGIPFSVRDVVPDIFSNPYIKPFISYIKYALGDHRRELFLDIMNKPVRYISRDMLDTEIIEIKELYKKVRDKKYVMDNLYDLSSSLKAIKKLSPFAAVNYIRKAVGYDKYISELAKERNMDYDELISNIEEFHNMLTDIETFDEMFDMIETTREMRENIKRDSDNRNSEGVQLMTLHSAKGLEFRQVHIMDVVEDSIPHKKSKTPDEIEEERRLLYVGVTRSSEMLYLYTPKKLGEKKAKVSRFIKQIFSIGDRNGIS